MTAAVPAPIAEAFTREQVAPGLAVWQPRRGFRYGLDAFCLAGWALEGGRPQTALDVGTGSGIIALLLRHAGVQTVEALDAQAAWVGLARRSVADSGLALPVHLGDVRSWTAAPFDLVVCNPPYWESGSGPVSPDPLKAAARHELQGTLTELVSAMGRLGDRLCLIVPARRAAEAEAALVGTGRGLARRCHLGRRLALLEARRDGVLVEDRALPLPDDLSLSPTVHAWYRALGVPLRPNPSVRARHRLGSTPPRGLAAPLA